MSENTKNKVTNVLSGNSSQLNKSLAAIGNVDLGDAKANFILKTGSVFLQACLEGYNFMCQSLDVAEKELESASEELDKLDKEEIAGLKAELENLKVMFSCPDLDKEQKGKIFDRFERDSDKIEDIKNAARERKTKEYERKRANVDKKEARKDKAESVLSYSAIGVGAVGVGLITWRVVKALLGNKN